MISLPVVFDEASGKGTGNVADGLQKQDMQPEKYYVPFAGRTPL